MITTNEAVQSQSRYQNGQGLERSASYNLNQACDVPPPNRTPILQAAQDLLPRIGVLIERHSRISANLKSVPQAPDGKEAKDQRQDLELTIERAHGGLSYLEQVTNDIERSLGL